MSSYLSKIIAVRLKTEQVQLAADCVFFECGPGFGKCLGHRHFLKEDHRENLEQSVEGGFQGEALLDDGNEDVARNNLRKGAPKVENPWVGRKAFCRCSRATPRKNSE
jgi:hypothetical protein